MNNSFWQGKRVFLTGHTGFQGGWLSLWLQRVGALVTGFSLPPPTQPSLFEAARIGEQMQSITGDIRDLPALLRAMRDASPEIVIHMAAQSLVRPSYREPIETYSANIMGTAHVLEAVRQTGGVRAVINITSDKCYENREWIWGYRENEAMGGHDPYSSSKGCAELITAAYRNSFFAPAEYEKHGVAVASARTGNVIGGGDWAADRLVPDILRAIEAGKAVNIRSPHAIRPWQHVLDPISGYMMLAEKLYTEGANWGGGWNFGPNPDDSRPVQWIVEKLTDVWGHGASWTLDKAPQPHEAHVLTLDCSKARSTLGWHACWSLDKTLHAIVEWQQAFLSGSDMKTVSLNQIAKYTEDRHVAH